MDIFARCHCGELEFSSSEPPIVVICCHCQDCRDATGEDFSRLAFFKNKSVSVQGAAAVREFVAESGNHTTREFCEKCGSIMFDKSEGFPGLIGVLVERVNTPLVPLQEHHVWVQSKLPHVKIPDGAKQFEKGLVK